MLAPGAVIGNYEVIRVLGHGGMGIVFLAHDRKLRRNVALKVLSDTSADEPITTLRHEAQALAALNHPSIAQVHDFEEFNGAPILVMEFVEGTDLTARLLGGPLTWEQALPIALQVADALTYAHARAIVHRDLKPSNIRIRDDGSVKVIDFGIAQQQPSTNLASPDVTTQPTAVRPADGGGVSGTPAYMSPEQTRGMSTSPATDIWAFGVVLFEMLSGKNPFEGPDPLSTMAAVLEREPNWGLLPSATPPPVVNLLKRCLEKRAEQRPKGMEAVTEGLRQVDQPSIELRGADAASGPIPRSDQKSIGGYDMLVMTAKTIVAVVILLTGRAYVDTLSIGEYFENFEIAVVQAALRVRSALEGPSERLLLEQPVVVDISPADRDSAGRTNRTMLEGLVRELFAYGVSVVGIDVDFSPEENGDFISEADPQLFANWADQDRVRVGVFRWISAQPGQWLGRPQFRSVAAGIIRPWNSNFALLFVKKPGDAPDDYLLQMPAALYEAAHTDSEWRQEWRASLEGAPGAEHLPVQLPGSRKVQFEVGRFPIDYSGRERIKTLPYKSAGDLELFQKDLEHHPVLIGDARDVDDVIAVPSLNTVVPGVVAHALALDTLNRGLLRFVSHSTNKKLKVVFVAVILAIRLLIAKAFGHSQRREIALALAGAGVAVAGGFVFVSVTKIFWPEFLWMATALLAEPLIAELIPGSLRNGNAHA